MAKDASFSVVVPEEIVDRVRGLCLALPEVTVRVDESRSSARSAAWVFDVRRRPFCGLVAREYAPGRRFRCSWCAPIRRSAGRCWPSADRSSPLRTGHDRIAVALTRDTDWEEIRELVTESYRIRAPKKLSALLDELPDQRSGKPHGVVPHPDVGLPVVALTAGHGEGGEPVREHVLPVVRERHPDPGLPVPDRGGNVQRPRRRAQDPAPSRAWTRSTDRTGGRRDASTPRNGRSG